VRVVILDTSNPDEMTGGQSVFIRNLIPHLDAEVRVAGATSGREALGRWYWRRLRGVDYAFMPIVRMPPPGRRPLLPLRFSSCLGVARFRSRILAAGDVMYVHSPEMGLPLVVGPRGKPLVLHLHGAGNPLAVSRYPWARRGMMRRFYAILRRRVARGSSIVLSVDDDGVRVAEGLVATRERRPEIRLVPVCVDEDLFHPGDQEAARARLGLCGAGQLLLFVGRLELAKGTDRLTDAFVRLAALRGRLSLGVIGDGSQRAVMQDVVINAGVVDRVSFAGWVDHESLPTWYQAADVLLLPSDAEGLPTAVIEALACGIPVVVSAVGGLPGLVEDGVNGLLLPQRTTTALTAAMATALDRVWLPELQAASVDRYKASRVAGLVREALCEAAASQPPVVRRRRASVIRAR
jgi:glycosyltransferase involved in cell wall biosynthesis